MKLNNKGFSLIEILGVIVLIAIISGIVGVSYANLDNKIDLSYYMNLEESILLAGNDYFYYNKNNILVNEEIKVNIKTLIDKNYINDTSKIQENCDLENSYVGEYKESYDKTNYFVCLVCDDYVSSDNRCFK